MDDAVGMQVGEPVEQHTKVGPRQTDGQPAPPESEELAPVRESWATGESIEWVKVHMLPDYAYFDHSVHVAAGVGCVSCHGRIDQMPVVWQHEPLSMGWCLDCHRNPEPNLRPPSEVTNMGYDNADYDPSEDWAREPAAPLNCGGCHR